MDDKQLQETVSYTLSAEATGAKVVKGEFYKPIHEDNLLKNGKEATKVPVKPENGESKMVQEENVVNDGADEQMLSTTDNEKLASKRDEVKFIKGDHQNGDAKIDIGGINGKAFTGMTKEELMKYANDPFWVRLRWIFFIAFWAIWVAMLVGAILIIIGSAKCAAPEPLPAYKRGPLAAFGELKMDDAVAVDADVEAAKKLHATMAIYELPAEDTYAVKEPVVEQKIKNVVSKYKAADMNVILDITPNYAHKDSALIRNAATDESQRSALVWKEQGQVPNNWVSLKNGSAWNNDQSGVFVLSQFGDGLFDLRMNDTYVRRELSAVLRHLIALGVSGIRLKNSKFYLISVDVTANEELLINPNSNQNYAPSEYKLWTHSKTTFQEGLGDLLADYAAVVKNASAGEAFLSVAEDMVRPEVYNTNDAAKTLGIELPLYGRFIHSLSEPQNRNLSTELNSTLEKVGEGGWLQWPFDNMSANSRSNPSALVLFVSLLRGVPVIPVDSPAYTNVSEKTYKHVSELRLSPSYMHGDFILYNASNLVAYSRQRIKSGNPGYFVVFNPTDVEQQGNFNNMGLPDKMTVYTLSDNYDVKEVSVKSKVMTDSVVISPYATIIFTYVPVKSG